MRTMRRRGTPPQLLGLPRLTDLKGQSATRRIGIDWVVRDIDETGSGERRTGIERVDDVKGQGGAGGPNAPAGVQVDRGERGNPPGRRQIGVGVSVGVIDGGV